MKKKINNNQNPVKSGTKETEKRLIDSSQQKKKNEKSAKNRSDDRKLKYNRKLYFDLKQRNSVWLKEFIDKFRKNLDSNFFLKNDSHILIAVSGGVDSVVLFDAFFQLTEIHNFQLSICHFNHKIRPATSDDDEKFVRNLAQSYGINFYTETGDVKSYAKKRNQSTEMAARNMRYSFFERLSKSINANFVALAHTANDTAETVLINLFRGSGLTGLSGIPPVRNLNKKIQIIRPFLPFKKEELKKYAEFRNINWHEDETNSLFLYTRNKIRHDLLKKIEIEYNPQIVETLNRTASLISAADSFVKEHIKPFIKTVKWNKDTSTIMIQIQLLKTIDKFIQGEIIQDQLEERFNLQGLTQDTIDRIISLTDLDIGSVAEIGKSIIALRDRQYIIITKNSHNNRIFKELQKTGIFSESGYKLSFEEVSKKQIMFNDNSNIEYFDYDKIPAILTLRSWEYGDTFKPLGMNGSIKISDFLINNKVSLFDKRKILVIASKNEIIWLCGYRINDNFKVTESTTRYLKATIEFGKHNEN